MPCPWVALCNRQSYEVLFVVSCAFSLLWCLVTIENELPCTLFRVWRLVKLETQPPVCAMRHLTATQRLNDALWYPTRKKHYGLKCRCLYNNNVDVCIMPCHQYCCEDKRAQWQGRTSAITLQNAKQCHAHCKYDLLLQQPSIVDNESS
jgi:hypothetical protein